MDLLARSHSGSSSAEYWDRVFKKPGFSTSEWYGGYHDLSGILHKYIRPSDQTLFLGDGNSCISANLYDVGYRSLVNVDESESVLRQMSSRCSKTRPEMKFLKMDVGADASFNAVLDRGTLDSLMTDDSEEACVKASQLFVEVGRILKIGGRYVCNTLAAHHTMRHLLKYFTESGWMVRLHKITRVDQEKEVAKQIVPVFTFICTKFKMMAGVKMPLEICMTDRASPERVDSIDMIMTAIEECKHYAMVTQILHTKAVTDDGIYVQLYSRAMPDSPRYTMHIVDSDKNHSASKKFGIFITPQGRETEWMFCTDKGREKLAESAGFQRLLVVSLHRDHTYTNMDSIKAELSCRVLELAPPGMLDNVQVPFLSIGDDIGQRVVRYRGRSPLTGALVVEDVTGDGGEVFRRLVFLSGMSLVQSQARLLRERPKKGRHKQKNKGSSAKTTVDHSYLEFDYQKQMVAGLAAIPQFLELLANEMRILIIGLGAGNLPMFLHGHFPKLQIDVVELDGAVAEVAKTWFGFIEDQRMRVFVEDGLKYINKLEEETSRPSYHAIIFDVDAKDLSTGLNSPPRAFIEKEFLKKVDSVLFPQGVFMINLISRDEAIKQEVINDIKTIFPIVYTKDNDDEVNETLYAISKMDDGSISSETGKISTPKSVSSIPTSSLSPRSFSSPSKEHSTLKHRDASELASEHLCRLPMFGKDLQKLAQSASRGTWDPDMNFSDMMGKLQIR